MSRPKKKEISLNKESVLSLMQEIYNELVEQRATALRIQNKMLALMKDASDMAVIGPIIKEQQKIINDTVEKKLTLSKLQSRSRYPLSRHKPIFSIKIEESMSILPDKSRITADLTCLNTIVNIVLPSTNMRR